MKLLSLLTPAETLLLLDGREASLNDLLKYTFFDLMLKRVIKTLEVHRYVGVRNEGRMYTYIEKGEYFTGYASLPHEDVFLSPYQKERDMQVMFRHLVKMAIQNAGSTGKFMTAIHNSPPLAGCFEKQLRHKIFGGFRLTEKGKAWQTLLREEISALEKTLPNLIENDKEKSKEVLTAICGNVFLLDCVEFELFKLLEQEFTLDISYRETASGLTCDSFTYSDFDTFGDMFDAAAEEDKVSSGWLDCSGCSG